MASRWSCQCDGKTARYVRLQVPGNNCLHLDEVEVYAGEGSGNAGAWDDRQRRAVCASGPRGRLTHTVSVIRRRRFVQQGLRLAASLQRLETAANAPQPQQRERRLASMMKSSRCSRSRAVERLSPDAPEAEQRELYFRARWACAVWRWPTRCWTSTIWYWSAAPRESGRTCRTSTSAGGRSRAAVCTSCTISRPSTRDLQCLTESFPPGNVLRPDISYDGQKVLFAWCRHYPGLSDWPDKLDKSRIPEDSFYHLYEVNVDGTGLRQLTFGKYNDFDGRYLPNGEIVFCSTRRGQAIQCSPESAAATLANPELPECYVRCGGGPERPCAVYTLHVMDADGKSPAPDLCLRDVRVDTQRGSTRDGSSIPAGTTSIATARTTWDSGRRYPTAPTSRRSIGNYTRNPECIFEARSIPGSRRLIFTASGHHSITAGSLVLLDPQVSVRIRLTR